MCVIAITTTGGTLPDLNAYRHMWDANPHGAGFLYNPPATPKVLVRVKGLMTWEAFKASYVAHSTQFIDKATGLAKCDVGVHFRIATHGSRGAPGTHPHDINPDEQTALLHNGVIREFLPDPILSDSALFARFLSTLPGNRPWRNVPMQLLLSRFIGSQNKVPIFSPRGLECILNEAGGHWQLEAGAEAGSRRGVWYSNMHWLPSKPYSDPFAENDAPFKPKAKVKGPNQGVSVRVLPVDEWDTTLGAGGFKLTMLTITGGQAQLRITSLTGQQFALNCSASEAEGVCTFYGIGTRPAHDAMLRHAASSAGKSKAKAGAKKGAERA
jgi:hypothetical protein